MVERIKVRTSFSTTEYEKLTKEQRHDMIDKLDVERTALYKAMHELNQSLSELKWYNFIKRYRLKKELQLNRSDILGNTFTVLFLQDRVVPLEDGGNFGRIVLYKDANGEYITKQNSLLRERK